MGRGKMAQRLNCPMCCNKLIPNEDLVISDKVVFDLDKLKTTNKKIETIKCPTCKRRIRYFIDKN